MAAINKYYPTISSCRLPAALPETITQVLRAEGKFEVESFLFLAGGVNSGAASVTRLFVPRGPGVFRHRLQHRIDEHLIAAIGDLLDPPRLVLLGQIHTHEMDAFHSIADDTYSLDTPGFLSIVIPDFARGDSSGWQNWGFYECVSSGTFRRLEPEEIRDRFFLDAQAGCEVQYVQG